jgi:hypothetical protein
MQWIISDRTITMAWHHNNSNFLSRIIATTVSPIINGAPMKLSTSALLFSAGLCVSVAGNATGLATCESGKPESWQPQDKLQKMLTDKGWNVRRIKVDGGCYEVYALNDKGERVEAYFHPQTLVPVPTNTR